MNTKIDLKKIFTYTTTTAFICGLFLLSACDNKKSDSQKPQKISNRPKTINVTLKSGQIVELKTSEIGIYALPAGEVLSYSKINDERNMLDDTGAPMIIPVYKHQIDMTTKTSIDDLIKFFFDSAPEVITRRKLGGQDAYVRIVSTKDTNKLKKMDEPYVIIDMSLSYSSKPVREPDNAPVNLRQPQRIVSPLEDKISAIRTQVELIKERLNSQALSIPERRVYDGQKITLESELSDLESQLTLEKQKSGLTDNDSNDSISAKMPKQIKSTPVIKVKIISYNKRG